MKDKPKVIITGAGVAQIRSKELIESKSFKAQVIRFKKLRSILKANRSN